MEGNLHHPKPRPGRLTALSAVVLALSLSARAELTNAAVALPNSGALAGAGPSLLRVLGALGMVLGLFLGGVWLFRNGRQLGFGRGAAPRLKVLESRSLGGRQAIYVVGYEQERFLVGATQAGINLLTHLPPATEEEAQTAGAPKRAQSFAETFTKVLKSQLRSPSKAGSPQL